MNALELTQRQRKLLENIAKAVQQYQQATADASARLERELKQIEQSRRQERQRIEEEREEKIKRIDEHGRLQQEVAARRSTITLPTDITTIEAVKEEINRTLSTKMSEVKGCILSIITIINLIILLGSCYSIYLGIVNTVGGGMGIVSASIVAFIVSWNILNVLSERKTKMKESFLVKKITLLHHLYDRWLELVDERAGAQRAEAQRRYDQAVAQAKDQMLAAAEQSHLAIAEFGALTEQVSPSWESEAWRRWEPGRVGPGAVRLGVFKMEV